MPSVILLDAEDVDEDDDITWTLWKSVDKKVSLQKVTGTIRCLLDEIDERWPTFLLHAYTNRQQRYYIQEMRDQSSLDGFVVVQLDFAENYRFVRQREPQSAHWNTDQATLFTVHFKIGAGNRCMVFISDYMEHDSKFVWAAQRLIVGFVKEEYPQVRKICYVR